MNPDIFQWLIAILGGFFAGVMNALAGFGSVITLSIMINIMGLPGNLANGTNRISVLTQSAMSTLAYYQKGKLSFKSSWPLILITSLGALMGVYLAVRISNEAFMNAFRFMLIGILIIMLIKPKRWLRKVNAEDFSRSWYQLPLAFLVGILGGFIQMGMGLFMLIVMVLIGKYNIIHANAIKAFIVMFYTAVVLLVFQYSGLIDWKVGLIFAIGQGIGGYLAAYIASVYPKADLWVYRFLILIVIAVLIKSFNVIPWIQGMW